ncbi:SPOR domain-containing protein [Telmatospirillum sp.]|uniref:SPOR domain-containing protein n=1 Tax=Telmatospirillum sp. TaxID=2079197 RepID=UPI002840D181|nr:SPOR domain-containing protein [Telmatospirillum sp.]MDR3435989.1 SPOR domain-containing protein [Telmatospirillum sp.]
MPSRDDRDSFDREILDIIPERFDADPDSRYARKGAHTRLILTVALAILALAALGVAARHIFFGEAQKAPSAGVPAIHADDRPIKTKPDDRGGMDVPNQDKLVYEKMGSQSDAVAQTERLLPPPETPQEPPAQPRKPSIKPAFPTPNPNAAGGKPTVDVPASIPAPATGQQQAAVPAAAPPVTPPTALSPAKPTNPTAAAKSKAAAAKAPAAKVAAASPPPAPPPSPPAAAPATTAPAAAGGHWLVQLGALKSESDAKNEWQHVKIANKDVLGDLNSDIVRVDLGEKGIFWRLRAGPMDEGQARTICASLSKRSQGCIIAKK